MLNTFGMYALKSESRVLSLFAIHTISHPLSFSRSHSICVMCVYVLVHLSLACECGYVCVCVCGWVGVYVCVQIKYTFSLKFFMKLN